MPEKEVTGYIIFNWKTNGLRVIKTKPKKVGPYEIPLTINLKVIIPEAPDHELNVEIEVPETKVAEMMAEAAFGENSDN